MKAWKIDTNSNANDNGKAIVNIVKTPAYLSKSKYLGNLIENFNKIQAHLIILL